MHKSCMNVQSINVGMYFFPTYAYFTYVLSGNLTNNLEKSVTLALIKNKHNM